MQAAHPAPPAKKTETLPSLYPASCRLPIWEDERPFELESESDVTSAFRETVGRTLLRLQMDTGISWLIQAPSCTIQEGVSFFPPEQGGGAAASQPVGPSRAPGKRVVQQPSIFDPFEASSSGNPRFKMDLTLCVPDEAQKAGRRRCICVGEVKVPAKLMVSPGEPVDLVAAWNAGEKQARAVVAQLFTYMQVWRMCYGFVTCWFGTWLAYCPPQKRSQLYVSHGIPSTSAHTPGAPAMTTMGALAWMQNEALTNAKQEVAPYPDPDSLVADTRGGRGGSCDNWGSGGTDEEEGGSDLQHVDTNKDPEWTPNSR